MTSFRQLIGIAAIVVVVMSVRTAAAGTDVIYSTPNAADAIHAVYGASVRTAYLKTATYTVSLFDQVRFTRGTREHLAVFLKTRTIDPETGQPAACHACDVNISGAVYRHDQVAWQLVSKAREFANLGSWGDAHATTPIQIIYDLAPDTTAFLFDSGWVGWGISDNGKAILAQVGKQWKSLGYINTDGEGAFWCERPRSIKTQKSDLSCWKYHGKISILKTRSDGFRDILVRRTGTIGDDESVTGPVTDVRYIFSNGSYYEAESLVDFD
jgi:hypothetical protein